VRQVAPTSYQSNRLCLLAGDLARNVNKGLASAALPQSKETKMSHLDNIANRQKKSLVRDALFATAVAFAAIVSVTTVTQVAAANAAVAHR
jgi:hypothetical protein